MWYRVIIFFLLIVVSTSCKALKTEPEILYKTITTSRQTYVHVKPVLRSERIETLKEGEPLNVIQEPKNKWLQVRTPSGLVGWVETRDVLKRELFEEWEQLVKKIDNYKTQMKGETYEEANLRLRPGRDSVKVHKLTSAKPIEIFSMAHTERPGTNPDANRPVTEAQATATKPPSGKKTRKPSGPKYDTWFLVRTSEGMVGWIYSGLVNLDVPEELARYSDTKTIIAWSILTISKDDKGQEHPWYLAIEREEASNKDFDRVRVLYWNPNRKRYEMAHRIQNITGILPFESKRVDPGESGQPSFKIRYFSEEDPTKIIIDEYQISGTKVTRVGTNTEGA